MSEASTSAESKAKRADKARRLPWYVWDILVLGPLFGFLLFYLASGAFSYSYGTRNDGQSAFGMIWWFVLLTPLVFICLVAATVRVLAFWPRHIGSRTRLRMMQIGAAAGLVACVGLPFAGIMPLGYQTYTWGFRQYAQANIDVPAVQRWLAALEPGTCTGGPMERREWRNASLDWPKSIVRCDPDRITLSLDEEGAPLVRLTWIGFDSWWGVVVGRADMEIPETQPRKKEILPSGHEFYNEGEYRLPLAPGAYVWHNIR